MSAEYPTWVYVTVTDTATGMERVVQLCYSEEPAEAAQKAFRAIGEGSGMRVREIKTFSEQPRWWDPSFEVKEIQP